MSNKKPKSIIIATKRNSSIKDVLIAPNYPNSFVKVLELNGMTNAIVRSNGSLDQKFVLFFDQFYGIAPITFCKFAKSKPFRMILGTANGEAIVYENTPHKSLLEDDYIRIRNPGSSSSIIEIIPHNQNNEYLIIHSSGQQFHEFFNWKRQTSSIYACSGNFSISGMKTFCPIYSEGRIVKVAFLTFDEQVFVAETDKGNFSGAISNSDDFRAADDANNLPAVESLSQAPTFITKIPNSSLENAKFLQISNSKWFILTLGNRILVCCHESFKLVDSFTLPSAKEFLITREIACDSQIFELFVYTLNVDSSLGDNFSLLKLRIDPNADQMEVIQNNLISKERLLSIHVTPSYFLLVSIDGIFIHDTLNLQRINKCSSPKFSVKYINEEGRNDPLTIEEFEENKFMFLWGNSLAQIWDFAPISKQSTRMKMTRNSSQIDKTLVGGKAIRKYSKYAVDFGYTEWKEEQRDEQHLDSMRDRLNIEGLTEEELVAYATLISKEATDTADISTSFEFSGDDPDLQLALQLSLTEM